MAVVGNAGSAGATEEEERVAVSDKVTVLDEVAVLDELAEMGEVAVLDELAVLGRVAWGKGFTYSYIIF